MHKSDRGYMDLTFNDMSNNIEIFNKYIPDEIISEEGDYKKEF